MTRILTALTLALLMLAPAARAQDDGLAWVQIEAQPSLAQARESIRGYAAELQDVNGFSLGGNWYAIALGPYTRQDAEQVLRVLRAEGVIPRDSYIAESGDYRQQFWPVGASTLADAAPEATEPAPEPQEQPDETTEIAPAPEPQAVEPDETPREARASERALSRDQRAELQEALKWAGFYGGAIDAAFGRGTRGAMARWQEANAYEATGILTTRQRADLLRQYNEILEGLNLQLVSDVDAGIEMILPTGVVSFDKYEPPFAHYNASGDIDAKVLLISQEGDEDTLAGLYDIMQTLEIVPETGPRTLNRRAFTLIGEGALTISHTQAWLKDGRVKGFTLIWPAGDEERRTRLLGEMQESFTRLDGVLDPSAGPETEPSIDLVSGLEVRKPKLSRSGFYVDGSGTVVTTAEATQGCGKITIDEEYEAQVATVNEDLGIAVLRPTETLAPMSVAAFQQVIPRLQADVAVAGYSYGGVLGAPTLTFGQLAELQGLNGEDTLKRLALAALEGDAGGPVVDAGGAVLGMLLPNRAKGRQLPEGVSFAADAEAVQQVLQEAGVSPSATSEQDQIAPEVLTNRAANMTVLVSCWE
ncbi:peptidoglycan-binding protein [Roseovarius sp. A21]|uniref:Peptidoglycan-binding protein n=1 Tax=Roseovarius bejariae TaxID=2576383 RepID=A0A844CIE6_9RHOB|nr:trypsin-like peptidase domain-containing protein [Roseovarius bejariae]MRU14452.1 peptidoglycan-binding protein [Roseovarius bejariae]